MVGCGARTGAFAVLALLALVLRQLAQSERLLKLKGFAANSYPVAGQPERRRQESPTNRTSAAAAEFGIEEEDGSKVTLFVHFHKAAGSSVVRAFLEKKRPWPGHHNGNPWGVRDGRPYIVEFWRHDAGEFRRFLREARLGGVEFIAMEWNFFERFTEDHLQHASLVTCVRDPYERFVSNLFHEEFDPGAPSRFVAANLTKDMGRVIDGRYALDPHFPLNFNKPNYYVAFMNGLATNHTSYVKLNRTHLDVAKGRLALFDAVFVLERPETFRRWLPEMLSLPKQNNGKARKMGKQPDIALTREQFYADNALDQEFYQYALNLSLSRMKKDRATGTMRGAEQGAISASEYIEHGRHARDALQRARP